MKKLVMSIVGMALGMALAWGQPPAPTDGRGVMSYQARGYTWRVLDDDGAKAGVYVYAGNYVPYEAPDSIGWTVPDSLQTVFVVHVGRHGSRYPTSEKYTDRLKAFLEKCPRLTPIGENVRNLVRITDSICAGRWGALDALGVREQSGIGHRFALRFAPLLKKNPQLRAISSYVPRCVMSMDQMTHGVLWEDRDINLHTASGPATSPLLRFFDFSKEYKEYKQKGEWEQVYKGFMDTVCPAYPIIRLCEGPLPVSEAEARSLTMDLYKAVAVYEAMDDYTISWREFFYSWEYGQCCEVENLRKYLLYAANGLSDVPAKMAEPLLADILENMEQAAAGDFDSPAAMLYFGHAETLMPLLSLIQLPGCYYVTRDWGSVDAHWDAFDVAPMASNLELILLRGPSGTLWVQALHDEVAAAPLTPWETFKRQRRF